MSRTIKYPNMTEEEWSDWVDNAPHDCSDFPECPLNLDDESGVLCVIALIDDYEGETNWSEICGRVNILRQAVYNSSEETIINE